MFTGIITSIANASNINYLKSDIEVMLEVDSVDNIKIGDSIAVNGVCLTVTKIKNKILTFYLSNETLERSNFQFLKISDKLNIEHSLTLQDGLSGHIVSGHVDFISEILSIKQEGESWLFEFSIEKNYLAHFVEKGSVTINGISLTVNKVGKASFWVNIIPHSFSNTNLQLAKKGDKVNIETDILAKYFLRYKDVYK